MTWNEAFQAVKLMYEADKSELEYEAMKRWLKDMETDVA